MIRFIVASQADSNTDIWDNTPVGHSLKRLQRIHGDTAFDVSFFPKNTEGLSTVYNRVIASSNPADTLVFIHDDIKIYDMYIIEKIQTAHSHFDIVGLIGSINAADDAPVHFIKGEEHSGLIAETKRNDTILPAFAEEIVVSFYPCPSPVRLLDGCFLSCRAEALHNSELRFDPQFHFHHYDLDFCRSAETLGVSTGTWPIYCRHLSLGDFSSSAWRESAVRFLKKWCPDSPYLAAE